MSDDGLPELEPGSAAEWDYYQKYFAEQERRREEWRNASRAADGCTILVENLTRDGAAAAGAVNTALEAAGLPWRLVKA